MRACCTFVLHRYSDRRPCRYHVNRTHDRGLAFPLLSIVRCVLSSGSVDFVTSNAISVQALPVKNFYHTSRHAGS